ncbi:uncharacterized protein [Magallana gigas]|uniref:uncharacterized protein isoform X2 n=1 Tax=Magallana gigas TaxID=29159 RepID=UPI00333EF34F
MELNWIYLTMELKDMSRFFTKVWNNTTLPKLSRGVSKWLSPEEDQTYKFLKFTQYESSSNEQETDGTGRQKVWNNTTLPKLSRGVSKTNCYDEPKTQGKERNDDAHGVVQEKSHCAGMEEMSNGVGKKHKFSSLADPESKQRKIGSMYFAAVCVLLLMYLPTGQGAPLGNTPEIYCGSYLSNLYDSSGPWNQSMCSRELEKIHCQTGEIRRCVPFISDRGSMYAACIIDLKGYTLKDDECILVTQIEGSNKNVAHCYGKDYCSAHAATSTPANLKSTNPLTPNATNEPLHSSSNKSTGTYNWTTVLAFLLCYWFIA